MRPATTLVLGLLLLAIFIAAIAQFAVMGE